jgi:hypothetical protein
MLSIVKVLVGKNNMRDYRGTRVKRTIVTIVKCISGRLASWVSALGEKNRNISANTYPI